MAIVRKATLPDNTSPIPQGVYNLAIISAKAEKAKSTGADMLSLEVQIVSPINVQSEGKTVKTAGRKSTIRLVATEKSNNWVREIEQLLGDPLPEEFDTTELMNSLAAEFQPSDTNEIKYLVGVELKPEPFFENQPGTYNPVIGADGQKVIRGYSFARASKEWPKAVGKSVAEQM